MRLRRWNASLGTRCADCTLDREIASSLAVILDECLYDICRRYEVRDEVSLTIGVDIRSEGSYLVAKIQDNGPDYWRDTEIDREDVSAFYQCLREVRGRLERYGALLWVEPSGKNEGRFKFTLPRTKLVTDYHIVSASGKRCAVPCHCVDSLLGRDSAEKLRDSSGPFMMLSGVKVPVYALDELACDEEFNTMIPHDHILAVGIGERRVGILIEGIGRRIESVADQVTGGSWGGLATSILHVGEEEFPIIDVRCVLQVVGSIRGTEGGPEEPGSYVDGPGGVQREETVPRA